MKTSRVLLLLGIFTLVSVCAFSQTENGLITGSITDQSGAAVAGANVTAKSINTGESRTATTNSAGNYTIANLRPDTYEISIQSGNFAPQTRRVVVTVGSRNEVSAALTVAGSSTTVEVTAEAGTAQVETQSSELSQVVSSQQVSTLPSLTRNPYDFVQTAGNVVSEPIAFGTPRGAGVNINGQRAASTNILLDGGENVNTFTAQVGQQVPLDSVQEFRVITNDFSAEYGRASGGVVNVATKSGTNAFHGSLYEFNRLSALASNTYDNNANGIPKSRFTRNQFGYSVGGPIVKNRAFFFNNTEWTRVRASANLVNWVVSPALIAAADPATQAYFAQWGQLKPGARILQSTTPPEAVAAGYTGAAPALNLVQYGTQADVGGGFPQDAYSTVARVDFNLTDKTTVFGRFARQADTLFPGVVNFSPYAGFDTGQTDLNQNVQVNLTHIWAPSFVTQHKVIGNRLTQQQPLGAQPPMPTLFLAGGPPNIEGQTLLLPGYSANAPGLALPFGGPQNVIETIHNLNWTAGRHQWQFGGQYVYTRDNRTFGAFEEGNGFYDITGDLQAGFEGFLAGTLSRYQVAVDPQGKFPCARDVTFALIRTPACSVTPPVTSPNFARSNRFHDFAFYGQDVWKATNRLTLNLGLRWEYYGVQHNKNENLDSNFYFGPGANFFERVRNGQVMLAPQSPVGGLWAPDKNNFGPRVGFAWDVFGNGKMAFRGGYGIAYERNFGNVTFNVIQNPPNYAVLDVRGSTPVPVNNFDPFTSGGVTTVPLRPSSLRGVDPNIRTAYSHQWNFSVQNEVAPNSVLSLEYSGSRGIKQYGISSINQTGYGCLFGGDCFAGAGAALDENGVPVGVNNRLNYQYTNINFRSNGGDSYYNALNVRFQSNNLWRSGVNLTTNYTWAHAIDTLSSTFSELNQNNNLGFLDPFNPRLDRGDADFDVRHRIAVSAVWDIPGYRNQPGTIGRILGGWQLAPILTAQSGYPFTIYDCTASAGDASCARYIPSGPVATRGATNAPIGPNEFGYLTVPAPIAYANPITGIGEEPTCAGPFYQGCVWPGNMTRRNAFRQPGQWNLNLGIYKNFKVTETVGLQFRGELYNAFNHSNFYVQTGGPFNNGGAADVSAGNGLAYTVPGKRGSTPTTTGSLGERRFVQFALRVNF